MKLSGNTVLITGGATGIGYAMAEAFLEAGSRVIICGRRESRLREARDKHPVLITRVCDVSKERDRLDLLNWIADQFPGLNVLVNNAGIQRDIDFTAGLEDFLSGDNEIGVNLEAPIVLSGLFAPLLVKNEGAAIINVSSGLGFVPAVKMPVYSATKAGMHAFSMAVRPQMAKVGIKVFEIVPPAIDTELNPQGRAKRGNFKAGLGPDEFVADVMRALESDTPEIGYGMSLRFLQASRAELDESFAMMNLRL